MTAIRALIPSIAVAICRASTDRPWPSPFPRMNLRGFYVGTSSPQCSSLRRKIASISNSVIHDRVLAGGKGREYNREPDALADNVRNTALPETCTCHSAQLEITIRGGLDPAEAYSMVAKSQPRETVKHAAVDRMHSDCWARSEASGNLGKALAN